MGKNSINRALKAGIKATNQTAKSMHREALADYNVALGASNAGIRNLMRQQGRAERNLDATLGNVANRQAILSRKAQQSARAVRSKQAAAVNQYGAALGASISQSFAGARTQGRAGVMEATGQQREGAGILAAGRTAVKIASQGTAAQKQSAAYALDQALQQRNIADNQIIAQVQGQLYQTALQSQLQWDEFKKQQQYLQHQQDKQALQGLSQVTATAGPAAFEVKTALMDGQDPATAVKNVMHGYGVDDPADPRYQLVMAAAIDMSKNNADPTNAIQTATDNLYGSYKGYDKIQQATSTALAQGVLASAHSYNLNTQADAAAYAYGNDYTGFMGAEMAGWSKIAGWLGDTTNEIFSGGSEPTNTYG